MAEEKEPVRLLSNLLFTRIFETFRVSIQPSKLAIAFLALTTICLTGWTMDLVQSTLAADSLRLPDCISMAQPPSDHAGVFSVLWNTGAGQFHRGLYSLLTLDAPGVFAGLGTYVRTLIWAFEYHPIYSVIFFVVVLAVLSLAGGAICRIAALQFAKAEPPVLAQAVRFSVRRFASLFAAPLIPLVVIAAVGLSIVLLGFLGNIPFVGELMVGLFLPLTLIAAGFVAVVLIGAIAGLNLMFPAIAYEDSDSFDAIGRSFAYVYDKLWSMGFYTVVTTVYGAVCYVFVRFFMFLLLSASYWFLRVGFALLHNEQKLREIWPRPTFSNFYGAPVTMPDTWSTWLGAQLIHLWVFAAVGLLVSFLISFYFSASTITYALMRHRVDDTPLDEVYIDSEEPAGARTPAEAPSGPTTSEPQPHTGSDSGPELETSE